MLRPEWQEMHQTHNEETQALDLGYLEAPLEQCCTLQTAQDVTDISKKIVK